jgi:hypothetical protein
MIEGGAIPDNGLQDLRVARSGRPDGAPFDGLRANELIPVMLSLSKHDRTRRRATPAGIVPDTFFSGKPTCISWEQFLFP